MNTRICENCNESKPLEAFPRYRTRISEGWRYTCKSCRAASIRDLRRRRNPNSAPRVRLDPQLTLKQRRVEYQRRYRAKHPHARAAKSVRTRLWLFLQRAGENQVSSSIGCSASQLRSWIEAKFQSGMTWDNYGQWHVDHVYPLSKALLDGPEAFKAACHYTNLQPLWAEDNLEKGAN